MSCFTATFDSTTLLEGDQRKNDFREVDPLIAADMDLKQDW
jgi:hypothetical protein